MHLICTGVACYLGYLAHRYEETSEERVQKLLEKHKRAPAEWAAMVKTEKGAWTLNRVFRLCYIMNHCSGIGYSEEKFSSEWIWLQPKTIAT